MGDQLEVRRNAFELTPLKSMDEVLEQEFKKGEIAAIRLMLMLPATVIETTTNQLEEMGNEDEVVSTSP